LDRNFGHTDQFTQKWGIDCVSKKQKEMNMTALILLALLAWLAISDLNNGKSFIYVVGEVAVGVFFISQLGKLF
jgi:hypothetical protein